jgi:hypothetical protein
MQLANALLALSGDTGNTVPKYNITPSEVAVLQFIHGSDAVTNIEILDREITVASRDERDRLSETYGAYEGDRFRSRAVEALFPGAAARVFQTFDEMGLDESLFKTGHAPKAVDPLDHDEDGKKGGSKKRAKKAEPVVEPEAEDGIEDMPETVMG